MMSRKNYERHERNTKFHEKKPESFRENFVSFRGKKFSSLTCYIEFNIKLVLTRNPA